MLIEITPNITTQINYKFGTKILNKDEAYIIQHSWVDDIICEKYKVVLNQYTIDMDLHEDGILFIRSIGMGDMLFLSPLISLIKNKYPNCKIGFAAIKEHHSILNIIPHIDDIIEYPIEKEIFDKYKYQFAIDGLIEGNSNNCNRNVYDVFLEHIGLDQSEFSNYNRPVIHNDICKDIVKNNKLIGIHPFAIDPMRQLNLHLVLELVKLLQSYGFSIMMFSNIEEKNKCSYLFNSDVIWSIDENSTSMSHIARCISSCNLIITTDSLILHLSQAVGTKCVCIFGPFMSSSRVGTYKNITILDTNPDCRCSEHGIGHCPKGYKISPCLSFEPQMIFDLILNNKVNNDVDIETPTVTKYNWRL